MNKLELEIWVDILQEYIDEINKAINKDQLKKELYEFFEQTGSKEKIIQSLHSRIHGYYNPEEDVENILQEWIGEN